MRQARRATRGWAGGVAFAVAPWIAVQAQDTTTDAASPAIESTAVSSVPVSAPAEAPALPASPATPVTGLGEIVVTAQRREESLNTIPLAVAAFSGEDLEQLGVSDTRDLGRIVPGFHASESGYSVPVYSLRGVGFNDISYSGTGTVGIYTDESPYAYAVMTKAASLDLQRVEVVKGPVGTLYGRNATGGAVNYIANKPTDTLEAHLAADYGRFETVNGSGVISGPLTESVKGRLAVAGTWAGEGWQFSNTRPDDRLGEQNRMQGRSTLDWNAADDLLLRLTLSGWYDKSDSQAPYSLELRPQNTITGSIRIANLVNTAFGGAGLPQNVADFFNTLLGPAGETAYPGLVDPAVQNYPYTPDNDNPRRADWSPEKDWKLNDSFWNVGLRSEWSIHEGLDLTAIVSFARFETDGSLVPQSGIDTLSADQENFAKLDAFSEEIRLAGTFSPTVNWLAGISGAQDDTTEAHTVYAETNSFNFGPPITGNPTGIPLLLDKGTFDSVNHAHSYGAFASVDWTFAERWRFTQGLRYTKEKRTNVGCSFIPSDAKALVGLTTVLSALSLSKGGPGGIGKEDCFTMDENGVPGEYRGTLKEHNFATRSVVDWTPVDDLLLFAGYTRGYKSGGFPQIFATDESTLGPATQERLIDYEIGAKTTTLDRRLHLEAGAYYYDYKDKQLLTYKKDPLFGPLPTFRNIPKSRVIGGEVSAQWVPVDRLELSLAAAYIDTKIQKFQGFTANGTDYDFAGRPFNYAPKFTATTMAAYTIPIGGRFDLSLSTDVSYSDDTNATLEGDPFFAIEDYWLLGAQVRLSRSGGPWFGVGVRAQSHQRVLRDRRVPRRRRDRREHRQVPHLGGRVQLGFRMTAKDDASRDLVLLQALRLKGRLNEETAARLAGPTAWARLSALAEGGLVTVAPVGARLAPPGRERLASLIAEERARVDVAALRELYEERFDDVNHALKAVVTSWQMKPSGTANDHADADYDAAVIARLAAVHGTARRTLDELAWLVPRLAPYQYRLAYALAQVQAGDAQYLTHPLKDSYHQVWFELHEELLALLGLSRVDEAKSGRA